MIKIYLLGLLTLPALYLAWQLALFFSYVIAYSSGYSIYRLLCLYSNRQKAWAMAKKNPARFVWELYRSIAWRWPLHGPTYISAESVQSRNWVWYPPMGFKYVGEHVKQ